VTTAADREGIRVLRVAGHGGVVLIGDCRGDPSAPTVVFLHGGGQTRHSWGGTATLVASQGWQTITLDSRGHGESDWARDANYQLSTFALDLAAVVDYLGAAPIVVGASLGGLTSILMAGELRPGSVAGLVLVDIIPDMEPSGADRIQSFMRERAATGFETLEDVADAVAAYNPHRPRPTDLSGLVKNLRNRDGRWYWHWDPAFIGGVADLGPREIHDRDRLNAAMASIDAPVMLVRGRQSDLVSEAGAQAFVRQFPDVEFVDVSGAGHMVAGDRNDAFTEAVLAFLEHHHPPR
jgi:peroxiredoxin